MRHALIIGLLALSLGACARDNYTVVSGGLGSPDRLSADLKDCKRQAVHAYYEGRSNVAGFFGAFGAVGGAVGGAIDDANTTNTMKPNDMNRMTEDCMRQKGYAGTSGG